MKVLTEPLNDQQKQVMQLREQGLTHAQIGEQMGFSADRASQLVAEARKRLADYAKHGQEALCLLPAPAAFFVGEIGCRSRTEVRAAIESGELGWNARNRRVTFRGRGCRGCGWALWKVLCEWARLPPPESARHCVTCPHCGGKVPL